MDEQNEIALYKKHEPFFGNWHIKRFVGSGGFAKVFEISRRDFGEEYTSALKIISVSMSESDIKERKSQGMTEEDIKNDLKSIVNDTVTEIKLMYKLRGCNNIVAYEDHEVISSEDGMSCDILIKMEFLTPLSDYIISSGGKINERSILKLGIDICRALEMCQKHKIIHRDIKLENIFISNDGDFKLGDFGIARVLEKKELGLSKKGTSTYMAPEVYKGLTYDSTVDIYSLGMVMYRILNNNRPPFSPVYPAPISMDERDTALTKRISGEKLPIPNEIKKGRLAEIVLKACEYNPKNRYSSPLFMREELESIIYKKGELSNCETYIRIYDVEKTENATDSVSGGGSSDKTEILKEKSVILEQTEVLHPLRKASDEETEILSSRKDRKVDKRKAEAVKPRGSKSIFKKKGILAAGIAAAIAIVVCIVVALMLTSSVTDVTVDEAQISIKIGETYNITELLPQAEGEWKCTAEVDNADIVKVDKKLETNNIESAEFEIEGIEVGEATVRFTAKNKNGSDETKYEGKIKVSVQLSEAEEASVNEIKTRLNLYLQSVNSALSEDSNNSSVNPDDYAYEREALEGLVGEFESKINGIVREADALEVVEYYNSTIVPTFTSFQTAYDKALEIAQQVTPVESPSKPNSGTSRPKSGSSKNNSSSGGSSSGKSPSGGNSSGGSSSGKSPSGGNSSGGSSSGNNPSGGNSQPVNSSGGSSSDNNPSGGQQSSNASSGSTSSSSSGGSSSGSGSAIVIPPNTGEKPAKGPFDTK